MNNILRPKYLPWITLAAGVVGFLLRCWLFGAAMDETGYLVPGHIAEVLIWVLTACVAALLLAGTARLLQADKYSFNFPRSMAGTVGCILGAAGIAVVAWTDLGAYSDLLTTVDSVLGFLSAAALVYIACCRRQGVQPNLLGHAVICVYFMLRLVSLYRHWSSDPQLQDYCFQLLATVCLMLATYHRTAFDADSGTRRRHVLYHLAAVYFCCLSLAGGRDIPFYFGAGAWMLTDLCSLIPLPREES